jgi:hypothetical protein
MTNLTYAWYVNLVISMGPKNAYKDMLDNVVSPITCISMNHQHQLEQMANGAIDESGLGKDWIMESQMHQLCGFASHTRLEDPNDSTMTSKPEALWCTATLVAPLGKRPNHPKRLV